MTDDKFRLEQGEVVKGRWQVMKPLGAGTFGAVYVVRDRQHKSMVYAMKTEDASARHQILKMEILVLKKLNAVDAIHACRLIARGKTEEINFVVMTLTSKSVEDVRRGRPKHRLSVGSGLAVAVQTVEALMELHGVGFLHRDLKPANLAVGRRDAEQQRYVFLLDFGLARPYLKESGVLRLPRESTGFRGTSRYAPLAAHRKEEVSRRDDLETWLYLVIDVMVGRLPWSNQTDKTRIRQAKQATRDSGALFTDLPQEFRQLCHYIDGLSYVDTPDYARIITILNGIVYRLGLDPSDPFDWETMPNMP